MSASGARIEKILGFDGMEENSGLVDEDGKNARDSEKDRRMKKLKLEDWRKQHQEYLLSPEWAKIKCDIMMERSTCEKCGSDKKLQIHHLTYRHWKGEEPEDLILLCAKHHMEVHGLVEKRKTKKKNRIHEQIKKRTPSYIFFARRVMRDHGMVSKGRIQLAKKLKKLFSYNYKTITNDQIANEMLIEVYKKYNKLYKRPTTNMVSWNI